MRRDLCGPPDATRPTIKGLTRREQFYAVRIGHRMSACRLATDINVAHVRVHGYAPSVLPLEVTNQRLLSVIHLGTEMQTEPGGAAEKLSAGLRIGSNPGGTHGAHADVLGCCHDRDPKQLQCTEQQRGHGEHTSLRRRCIDSSYSWRWVKTRASTDAPGQRRCANARNKPATC